MGHTVFHHPTSPDPSLRLRPEERLVNVEEVTATIPHHPLTSIQALQLLTGAKQLEGIGRSGPLLAAATFPENKDRGDLRRFETLFGRDALIVSYFLLDRFPTLAEATLLKLAELQGKVYGDGSEEEPGEIVHEARANDDPVAHRLTRTRGWQWPYYGSVDATPLFVRILARYIKRHDRNFLQREYRDRDQQQHTMYDALQQATRWIIRKMESNPDGLVESVGRNQSWKDSPDSYHHADGTLANLAQGVASIEVQAYAYDALQYASQLLHDTALATQCIERAAALRSTIMSNFWIEDDRGAYFALGSDRNSANCLRLLHVRASNMGHLLTSQLLDGEDPEVFKKKRGLVRELFSPALLTPFGIRTLAKGENRFRPTSYHNGTVWPWDTFYISLGLQRQGFSHEARALRGRISQVLRITKRFPEFISGADEPNPILPTRIIRVYDTKYKFEHFIEQPPQEIQAWTVAAAVAIDF